MIIYRKSEISDSNQIAKIHIKAFEIFFSRLWDILFLKLIIKAV